MPDLVILAGVVACLVMTIVCFTEYTALGGIVYATLGIALLVWMFVGLFTLPQELYTTAKTYLVDDAACIKVDNYVYNVTQCFGRNILAGEEIEVYYSPSKVNYGVYTIMKDYGYHFKYDGQLISDFYSYRHN